MTVPPHSFGDRVQAGFVRPYTRTAGRTTPSRALPIEAIVCTSTHGQEVGRLRIAEHRAICRLCRVPHSVAEVAGQLRLPLGIARVLLADLADLGLVWIQISTPGPDGQPPPELLQRVLSGLRRL